MDLSGEQKGVVARCIPLWYSLAHGPRSTEPTADTGQRTPQAPVHLPLRPGWPGSVICLHSHHSPGRGFGLDFGASCIRKWQQSTPGVSRLAVRGLGGLLHSHGLDLCCPGFDCGEVYCSEEALHVLLRRGVRGMPVDTLWSRAWGLYDPGPQSGVGEGVV